MCPSDIYFLDIVVIGDFNVFKKDIIFNMYILVQSTTSYAFYLHVITTCSAVLSLRTNKGTHVH
jgi:hypothetical protein